MARRRPESATLYDFRDMDIMHRLAETNGHGGLPTSEIADMLGFEEDKNRHMGIRLAWMRRYGFVAFNEDERTWSLSESGRRIQNAHLRAPALRAVEAMPDEAAVELMGHVVSRFQRGDATLGHMLRREFLYGTKSR